MVRIRRIRRAGLALLAVLVAIGCGRAEAPAPPRILLISVDTLGADHVGCYGAQGALHPISTPSRRSEFASTRHSPRSP